MEKIQKSIKILFFHPGGWLASVAIFCIIIGVVGVKQSLAMLVTSQENIFQKVGTASSPLASSLITPTPTPSLVPAATPTEIPTPTSVVVSRSVHQQIPVTNAPTPTQIVLAVADPTDDAVWERLAQCESNDHWADDTGNGYFGGLQFSQSAWESVGGVGKPSDASREEQIAKGKLLQARRGWGPWGGCSRALGLN